MTQMNGAVGIRKRGCDEMSFECGQSLLIWLAKIAIARSMTEPPFLNPGSTIGFLADASFTMRDSGNTMKV